RPLLATSWRQPDPLTWEFALRPGVTFQDGSPFSADDVVYTVNSVLDDPQTQVPSNYSWIAGAEKIDDRHVRLKLRRVFPAALEYLAMTLPILPQAYRERVGAAGYAAAPIGAGPYRFVQAQGSKRMVLERWGDYYADSPKGRPAIGRLDVTVVRDAEAELDALLSHAADWIWYVSPEMLDRVDGDPTLTAMTQESMRLGYLSLDAAGRTGPDNPLTKLAVRQAIFLAVDRQAIVRKLTEPGARVLDVPCYPTQFGCEAGAAMRYGYDPARARQLLSDAGYPDGFDTEIVSYVQTSYGAAVRDDLAAIGIRAKLVQLPVAQAVARSQLGEDPMDMGSWGSFSINDVSAILPNFFGASPSDYAGDTELRELVRVGDSTTNIDERRKAYREAIRRITANAYWLPLNTYVTTYGVARELNFRASSDELPRFFLSSWR
ncbi:MAG: ABC transporter substrate-binding protein, partial [Acetobacteraceae bacterium]|nr:ABC transporter substrate-binding protein [Acetobacteraceae bacterium]